MKNRIASIKTRKEKNSKAEILKKCLMYIVKTRERVKPY